MFAEQRGGNPIMVAGEPAAASFHGRDPASDFCKANCKQGAGRREASVLRASASVPTERAEENGNRTGGIADAESIPRESRKG